MRSWMIGLAVGIASVSYWPALPQWPSLLLSVGGLLLAVWRSPARLLCSGACLGCVFGCAHGTLLLQQRIAGDCVGVPVLVAGTVSSLPLASRVAGGVPRQRFEFTVSELQPPRCAGPDTLLLSYYGEEEILPGDRWQFEVKLKKPWGLANPGGYNRQEWLARNGIDAVGSVRESGRGPRRLSRAAGGAALADRLRRSISTAIASLGLPPETAAVLQAVSVADSGGIDASLWSLFQHMGINHLLVISGLHIGMVAAVGFFLGTLCLPLWPPWWRGGALLPPGLALVLAGLYAALAGFSLPVQRALWMLASFAVAHAALRRGNSLSGLLLAATSVLLLSPLAVVGSGFWLSFGAVAALLWIARWQRGTGRCWRLLQTQAAMSLLMLPLGALFFGGGSAISALVNLMMIPLVGWFVVPLALLGAASFLCGGDSYTALWQLAGAPLAVLLPQARELVGSDGNGLYLSLAADSGAVLLAVVSVAVLCLPGRSAVKLLAAGLLAPLLLPDMNSAEPALPETVVTVLDVGQGTAVVVRGGGRALVYDTGGGDPEGVNMGSLAVLPYLRERGVTALDTLVISHPDLDHSAGTAVVRSAMPVTRFRYGGERPVSVGNPDSGRPCIAGEAWRWPGGQMFQFLSPAREMPPRRNDSSCVLQIDVGGYRLLLPGDIEGGRERLLAQYWGDGLRSNWLLAAHHGSGTSTSEPFLKRAHPAVVVVSSGYANRFGHPHSRVIERLGRRRLAIYHTARAGALEFRITPGQPLQVTAHREKVRRYWM
ncbi:MAG: DNA internalization-related competence protein ComEC/Rec2 [Halioglobus sp.]|nr:DNA internalization-related competence protein ComEC/Rec2 [Halioglobus sp.]